eukprot:4931927-Prymnesium_polylepis.1
MQINRLELKRDRSCRRSAWLVNTSCGPKCSTHFTPFTTRGASERSNETPGRASEALQLYVSHFASLLPLPMLRRIVNGGSRGVHECMLPPSTAARPPS